MRKSLTRPKQAEDPAKVPAQDPAGDGGLLRIRDLEVTFDTPDGPVEVVHGVNLDVRPGDFVGLVGESGSGKSVTAMSVLGLHPEGTHVGGSIQWDGRELLGLDERALNSVRGNEIAMIFQDPLTSLNPLLSVGGQLADVIRAHDRGLSRAAVKARAAELLALVQIPDPVRQLRRFPHEFSGGMRQRVMIAMAIANRPRLLIADEPTTALDVTIQAQILEILDRARAETDAAVVLITHDLGVVAEVCDRVAVMYAGRIVESGPASRLFAELRHPYTAALLGSRPRADEARRRLSPLPGQPVLAGHDPGGCAFHPRCPLASSEAGCETVVPPLDTLSEGHRSACHRSADVRPVIAASTTETARKEAGSR